MLHIKKINRTLQTGRINNTGMLLCVVCTWCNKKEGLTTDILNEKKGCSITYRQTTEIWKEIIFSTDVNMILSRIWSKITDGNAWQKPRPSNICWAVDWQKIDMAEYTQWISFPIHYGKLDSIYLPKIFFVFADFCDFFSSICVFADFPWRNEQNWSSECLL